MTPTFTIMHPEIISIRLSVLLNALRDENATKANHIITVTREQMCGTDVSVLNQEEVNNIVEILDEVEILILLDVYSCAITSISDLKKNIESISSDRRMVCNMLVDNNNNNLGAISYLPMLVKDQICKILKKQYRLV